MAKQQSSDVELSERLAYLSIMEAQLMTLLKLIGPSHHYRIEGFKGGP